MKDNLKLYIEKTDNSKYAAAAFESYDRLINYQVKMLINNKIRYLLPAAMQQRDGRVYMYYDITNKISLSDYAKKERFNNRQFLGILNTIIKIDNETDEFKLINSGLVFDPDYVYVDLNGNNCEYIYIPNAAEPNDAGEIRDFLMEILRNGYIGADAQELVVNLYNLLQNPDMSIRDIKDLIYRFEDREKRFNFAGFNFQASEKEETGEAEEPQKIFPTGKNISLKPSLKPKAEKKPKPEKSKKAAKEKKEEKSTLPITLTAAGNALVLAGIYKIYTMGILSTEAGVDFTKPGVLILAVAVIDVIIVKELFFGDKNKEEKPKKEKKVKAEKAEKEKKEKQPKAKKSPLAKGEILQKPEFISKSEIRNAEISHEREGLRQGAAVLPEPYKKPEIPVEAERDIRDVSEPNFTEKILPENNLEFTADKTLLMRADDEIGNDETVLMINNEPKGYIERVEDGVVVDKYVIKKDKVIIGRLRSQVDMTVLNPKVGKIHAEISFKEGSFYIKDLSSKNGTYSGGKNERLKPEEDCILEDGDKFRLADSSFCIHLIK